ncbi:hypothetical protein HF1_11670 [Mycoplasma haemofelis str. Langford 1]|uniref:Uncharacterized protein n=1 Tax=Mycoplasma haemofelis (strain Langford 1) TaxID=941640 RepID=E8ZJ54_MYCHL|nr:hypothetical protein [Mycoplasma haemofelis]CBY93175.1 hypothetical protein HF1_11670 [Mycoplasma haemofelis str. Langford 1]
MATKLFKSLVTLGTGGAVSTGVYLTKEYWWPDDRQITRSISRALIEDQYVLLDASKPDDWSSVFEKYKVANPDGAKDVSQLQKECKELLSKELNKDNYKKARMWCVESQSVAQKLGLFNRSALSTDSTTDDAKWKSKIESHKSSLAPNKLNHDFKDADEQNVKVIKEKCSELSKKTNTDDTFESDFETSLSWCSVDIPNSN